MISDNELIELESLVRDIQIEESKESFWTFCKTEAPDFYTNDRVYLEDLCSTLQDYVEYKIINPNTKKPYKKLIIEMPPRHGKTRTLVLLCAWMLGRNNNTKIITSAYNDDFATDFSKYTRDTIKEQKNIESQIVFSDIFPDTKIKYGDASYKQWALEGRFFNFKSAGKGGSITGKGGTCFPKGTMIITEYGSKDISTIQNGERVLSYNHGKNIFEWQRVAAVKQSVSTRFAELTTADGDRIKATDDHKIFIFGKGYIKIKDVKKGQSVRVYKRFKESSFSLFYMWKRICQRVGGIYKKSKERPNRLLLLYRLFKNPSFIQTQKKMYNLRKANSEKNNEILLTKMQAEEKKTRRYKMQLLSKAFQAFVKVYKILFYGLQKQRSFYFNVGTKKLKLQTWERVSDSIQTYESKGIIKRIKLYNMRNKRKLSSTSQRRKHKKQFFFKSSNCLQKTSHNTSQVKEVNIFKTKPIKVYDIQVEKNNNFIANNILVHNCLLIDDPVKSAEDAFNANQLEKDWLWYTGTWISRKETNALEIINHTPWSKNDIGGRLQYKFPEDCFVFKRQACTDGIMLCESILSYESYKDLEKTMDSIIFEANYNLNRIDVKGVLYGTDFKTYIDLPKDENGKDLTSANRLWADTADKGSDYLCAIFGRQYKGYTYLTDVYYTKDSVEITEPELAFRIIDNKATHARIEGNAGGHAIGNHIKRILVDKYKWYGTIFDYFTQTKNKESRILSNAAQVKDKIIMPVDWKQRWPEFYRDVTTYMKEGKNANDDAPDTLTQIVECDIIGDGNYFIKRRR